ncbi:MAG TPA: RluA family pseudouridine synthase [Acidimicrobiales bacterium]|nr:RluA family pseudouridine synthase [Acidimicrobiales bacterium]
MSELSVSVPSSLDGVRVDRAVALLADISRSAVDHLVASGRVRVDGMTVHARSRPLREGELLAVELGEEEPVPAPEADPTVVFNVVHDDADIVVVDKPAGLVVHPGAGHRTGTLVNGMLSRYRDLASLTEELGSDPDRPGIVHRLDRGTSGLLVVARSAEAYRSLVAQLGDRTVSRHYRALVLGEVNGESGVVDAPIGRSVTSPTRMSVSRKGKEARTRYRVEQRFTEPAPATLVEATLETGRTHQIRVHLSAIGHPVVGDGVYARGRSLPGATVTRPFLHAYRLAFDHPRSGARMTWTSELPADLRAELDRLSS